MLRAEFRTVAYVDTRAAKQVHFSAFSFISKNDALIVRIEKLIW